MSRRADPMTRWEALADRLDFRPGAAQAADRFADVPAASGIYFWLAENGEGYIGKAVNLRARLMQLRRDHGDVRAARVFLADPAELDRLELRAILAAERHIALRNIKLVTEAVRVEAFDRLVSDAERAAFRARGNHDAWLDAPRAMFPELEARQAKGLRNWRRDADRDLIAHCCQTFVAAAIPKPHATEGVFWSASYLGQGAIGARINCGQQEVFTVGVKSSRPILRLMSRSRFWWRRTERVYATRCFIAAFSLAGFHRAMASARVLRGIRDLTLYLMRHTTPLNSRSHAPYLCGGRPGAWYDREAAA